MVHAAMRLTNFWRFGTLPVIKGMQFTRKVWISMNKDLMITSPLGSAYQTTAGSARPPDRIFPTFGFYCRFLSVVFKACAKAKRHQYDDGEWYQSSYTIFRALERAGVDFEISGIDHLRHLRNLDTPCVFIANHMSTLETVILPFIIRPFRQVTFIVKESLMTYPVFKHILRTRHPIVVNRVNPRQDLKTVMKEGKSLLDKGVSVIVFPQTTRSRSFDPELFNSLGVKLAARANVPAVPLALITDAWENGRWLKDFGRVNPSRKVLFAFGQPLEASGKGTDAHAQVIDFIGGMVRQWRSKLAQT
jgi:1-acyl-sn-glycerol-3-phosphate acyltransferase